MGTSAHHSDFGRRVLAESIELQQLVAADLAVTPLPPLPHRRRPVAVDVLLVATVVLVLAVAGFFVV
jgi:hypothetical protein